jgi:hypothetical protein
MCGDSHDEHSKKVEVQGLTVRYMDPAQMETSWADMEEQTKLLMSIAKEE